MDLMWFYILIFSLVILWYYWLRKSPTIKELDKKAVLITGCDTGFGHALAKHFDNLGITVFAGCLFPKGDGATQLKHSCSSKLCILPLDVTKEEQVQNAVRSIENSLDGKVLWAVVNNAGITSMGNMEWMSLEVLQRVMDVNTYGPFRVTKAFLPLLRKSRGRVVVVSSLGARNSGPAMGAYCMSKFAVSAMVDAFCIELMQFGIKVIEIQPALVRTGISDPERLKCELDYNWSKLSDEVKSAYGAMYIENYKNKTVYNLLKFGVSESYVCQVIDSLQDAVIGQNPKYMYRPGLFSKALYCAFAFTPKPLLDYVLCLFLPEIEVTSAKK